MVGEPAVGDMVFYIIKYYSYLVLVSSLIGKIVVLQSSDIDSVQWHPIYINIFILCGFII